MNDLMGYFESIIEHHTHTQSTNFVAVTHSFSNNDNQCNMTQNLRKVINIFTFVILNT